MSPGLRAQQHQRPGEHLLSVSLSHFLSLSLFQCLLLDAEPLDSSAPWSFFPLLLASTGIFYTVMVMIVFIVFNRTSIIMASGRELSFVLLGGILTSYACTFVVLAEPNEVNCVCKFCLSVCLFLNFIQLWDGNKSKPRTNDPLGNKLHTYTLQTNLLVMKMNGTLRIKSSLVYVYQ